MSRRRVRLRRWRRRAGTAVLVIGTLGSLVSAGMWVRSERGLDQVVYRYGLEDRRWPGAESPYWVATQSVFFLSNSGVCLFGLGEFADWSAWFSEGRTQRTAGGLRTVSLRRTFLAAEQVTDWRWASVTDWHFGGLGLIEYGRGQPGRAVVLPWSVVMGLFGMPAAMVATLRQRRARKVAAGVCLKCGYLMGHRLTDGVRRCSECGRVAEEPIKA
jgi:hypothetical protein